MGLYVDIEKKLKGMTLQVRFDTNGTEGITGILGASGCGKSMTLKSIAGIVTPDKGRIVLNHKVLFDSQQRIDIRVQKRRVGYLFQNYALFPRMTIRENIQIGVSGDRNRKKELCDYYMRLLRIEELADRYPTKLSGGQQQRAALARVLASEPEVLMLDEPFSALDAYLKEKLQMEILDVLKDFAGDILMVTHSRDEVYRFCRQIHVLDMGKVVASGLTKDVFRDPVSVAAARLTGCKNIVPVKRIGSHELEVPEWGLLLRLEREVPEWVWAVGIRAHYLCPVGQMEPYNVIECRWNRILEEPFEITGILDNGIWWKISKDEWHQKMAEQMPEYLRLPEESILLLKD